VDAAGAVSTAELTRLCQAEFGQDSNGSTLITHDAWGPTTVAACGPTQGSTSPVETVGVLAVDHRSNVKWSQAYQGTYYELTMADPGTDASGNVFVMYNPGRYDGVIILRPTRTGIDLLVGPQPGEGSSSLDFYGVEMHLVSGLYEITVRHDDCIPDCATSESYPETFTWNGTTYVSK